MKKSFYNLVRILIVLTLISSMVPSYGADAQSTDTTGASTPFVISGRVTNQSGAPLRGVMVKAALHTGNVVVKDELGAPVSNAQVFSENGLLGLTDSQGILAAPVIAAGNRLYARSLISEVATNKYFHNQDSSSNWAYRIYITSLDVPLNTEPQGQLVDNPTVTQTLTIKKSNPLVGFNLLVAVEWDADSAYMNDLKLAFERASAYLYDLTDGQMVFEQVNIYDNNENAGDVDFYFQASNQAAPHVDHDGMLTAAGRMSAGRYFTRTSSSSGAWSDLDGYRTLVYLFSQYGLGLYDSGMAFGNGLVRQNAVCTSAAILANQSDTVNATPLYWRYNASEFSLQNYPGLWAASCTDTLQFQKNSKSEWETLQDRFQDQEIPARYNFATPAQRGGISAGPQALGLAVWTSVTLFDGGIGLCTSPVSYLVKDESNHPVPDADVLLVKPASRGSIRQGKTNAAGQIDILGAKNGDQLIVNGWGGKFRSASAYILCSANAPSNPQSLPVILVNPSGFGIETAILPGPGTNETTIVITTTTAVTNELSFNFSQYGDPTSYSFSTSMAPNERTWTVYASLSPLYPQKGVIAITASNNFETVKMIQDFDFHQIDAAQETVLHSNDGLVELTLPANAAPGSGGIHVTTNALIITATNSYSLVSGPFTLEPDAGYQFPAQSNLAINFHDPGGLLQNVDRRSMRIGRWDGQSWVLSQSNQSSATNQTISTIISQPGTYALLVKPQSYLFLPSLSKIGASADWKEQPALQPLNLYAPLEIERIYAKTAYSMSTDINGYYTFTNIAAGDYLVTAVQPGFTFDPANIIVGPSGASGQNFTRQAGTPALGETIFIPGGSFSMGCDPLHNGGFNCPGDTKPLHTVILDPYFISKYPVTTAQYAACVTAGNCTQPMNLNNGTRVPYYGNPLYSNFPVVWVTWQQSATYCAWAGGGLPSEAQWEKAARGETPRSYPWGDTAPNCSLANYSGCVGNTAAVTASIGVSPYGVMDMSGNMKEWVNDWYDPNYYTTSPLYNPTGPATMITLQRVTRGGGYLDSAAYLLTSYRLPANPGSWFTQVGFRCQSPVP